jgi:hypothetical protein
METSCQFYAPAALSLGKYPPLRIGYEAGPASESVWTRKRKEKISSLLPARCETPIVQPVAYSLY